MGLSAGSIGQLALIFLIGVMLFGSSKLKQLGEDLGSAIRGFQKGLKGKTDELLTTDISTSQTASEQTTSNTVSAVNPASSPIQTATSTTSVEPKSTPETTISS